MCVVADEDKMMSDCHDLAAVKCGVRVTLYVIVSLAPHLGISRAKGLPFFAFALLLLACTAQGECLSSLKHCPFLRSSQT